MKTAAEPREHHCPECRRPGHLGHRRGCSKPRDVEVNGDPSGRFGAVVTLRGDALVNARIAKIDAAMSAKCAHPTCADCVERMRDAMTWCGLGEGVDYKLTLHNGNVAFIAVSAFGREVLWPFFPPLGEA